MDIAPSECPLRKLEEATGIGRRCLDCRVHYIKFGYEIRRTAAEDLFVTSCSDCGQTLKFIYSGYMPREREVLTYVSTEAAGEQ